MAIRIERTTDGKVWLSMDEEDAVELAQAAGDSGDERFYEVYSVLAEEGYDRA